MQSKGIKVLDISIHAPSRERPTADFDEFPGHLEFQSTLPHGSDLRYNVDNK